MPKHYTQLISITGKEKGGNTIDIQLMLWAVTPEHNHGSSNEFTKQGMKLIESNMKAQKVKDLKMSYRKFMSNQNKPSRKPDFQLKHNKKKWVRA